MKARTGEQLYIRSLIEVSSEVIPYFWPMRNFIHHNPLYGLEHVSFKEALSLGRGLFGARTFLPRETYRRFLKEGKLEERFLKEELRAFVRTHAPPTLSEEECFELSLNLLLHLDVSLKKRPPDLECCEGALELSQRIRTPDYVESFKRNFIGSLGKDMTLYEAFDLLLGTDLGETINELVIRACTEFLDEGQAVWSMPRRREGFYRAWRNISLRDKRLKLVGCCALGELLGGCEEPEEAVELALKLMEIPKELWEHYFPLELAKLHGWAGFIRWRGHAKEYYWQRRYPADLVDFLAVRLTVALSLLKDAGKRFGIEPTFSGLCSFVNDRPEEAFLRYELFSNRVLPAFADELQEALEHGDSEEIGKLCAGYVKAKATEEAKARAVFLMKLFKSSALQDRLMEMEEEEVNGLLEFFRLLEEEEGYLWLKAHERSKMENLVKGISPSSVGTESRPFAQALFCIDVRSERFRRNLESLGSYETYGIAGFFGVPISFIELGKGHETYLCPVLIKPKNVVIELSKDAQEEKGKLWHLIKEILHDLKYNVLTPYITVEAIGLLFGFDMVGKTLFPLSYSRFREKMEGSKGDTRLVIDKLSKEEAVSIVRTLQMEIIKKAYKRELALEVGQGVLELTRAVALEEAELEALVKELGLDRERLRAFVEELRQSYKVDKGYTRIHVEKLAKVGFTLEEQVHFVEKALKMIGLTENFGKFVLVLGHGSKSDNNPYESALDCGACGGDHGAVNARVFCLMANNPRVRRKLKERGIEIPEDTHFLAGEHNTTTDGVELLDTDLVPATHRILLDKVREDLLRAGEQTAYERCKELPMSRCTQPGKALKEVLRNSVDWTQVRPEWGLSGNYAFVIGRRDITKELNLKGRVFLHSYDYRIDPKGFYLENILSGPLVVGEWINMEHYFSAVDNEHLGSGSKIYHNVVGRFGVMSGNLSDLRTGLPAQTVLKGDMPHHEPVRLITLIEAPLELVKRVLMMVPKVRELVHNGWINLVVLDPERGDFFLFSEGAWRRFNDEEYQPLQDEEGGDNS